METIEVPQTLEYRGGQLNAAPALEKRILEVDQLTKDLSSSWLNDLVFVKSSADDTKVIIPGVERPWLSEVEGFILPNHDNGRILPSESQRNTIESLIAVTNSSVTDYDSTDESLVCSIPLPPPKKLDGVEPISRPKTLKSIFKSKSTFKIEVLKDVTINEVSSALAKGNKSSSASKVHTAPAGKLKSVKIKDDPPLAIMATKDNLGRLLPHARGLGFKPRCGGFPSGEKKEWGLSPKAKVRVLHTAQLDVTWMLKAYDWCQKLHAQIYGTTGPKEVFGDDSTCTTKGDGSIKCNGMVFTKKTIFNSNKEVVMIAPRVRDVYVLDMTSSAQESCFFVIKDLLI
uniref:Retrovirus-related Pol polyprotein from transposon TNT 1-94 n=1 Tax=Tanacetum cinerariifolium TaxID=118510 RepID=A0A6L2JYH6_TANCI|nr:retrovirus-related Pol polyprotein from transposon TNT 1-94 [Tanacetum cinerariifolium]